MIAPACHITSVENLIVVPVFLFVKGRVRGLIPDSGKDFSSETKEKPWQPGQGPVLYRFADGKEAALSRAISWLGGPVFATTPGASGLIYINTGFENASPLYWETDADNRIHVYLIYDQERASPNRANGHWFFEVEATPNTLPARTSGIPGGSARGSSRASAPTRACWNSMRIGSPV